MATITPVLPDIDRGTDTDEHTTTDMPWQVIVWDDPVNLIPYVATVFQRIFGWDRDKAMRHTMLVHNEGRCGVFDGTREQAEGIAGRIQAYHLWATISKAGGKADR